MASATLRPSNVYQISVINGQRLITAVNPSNLDLKTADGAKLVLLEFNINSQLNYYNKILSANYVRFYYINDSGGQIIYLDTNYVTVYNETFNAGELLNMSQTTQLSTETLVCEYDGSQPPYKYYGRAIPSPNTLKQINLMSLLTSDKFYLLCSVRFSGGRELSVNVTNNFTLYLNYENLPTNAGILINPSNSFLDRTKANTFSLSADPNYKTFHIIEIESGTYHYKLSSASTYSNVNFSGSSFTIPANTLANSSQYNIYATAVTSSGTTSDTNVGDFTTVDVKGEVTAISPKNVVTQGNITFDWDYSAPTGTQQFAYDLDISYDNGTSWENIANHVVSSNPTSNQTISTSGTIYWRVRGYNQSNIPSDYS